jgi:hypothetical protein
MPLQDVGSFIPTTSVWDVSEVLNIEGLDPQLSELLVRMYQNLSNMATVLNGKDTGMYVLSEFTNGQQFFQNPNQPPASERNSYLRQDFRVVINFGALPNNTTKAVPHGVKIVQGTTFTRIYGAATNPSLDGVPLPYASASATPIELYVDPTNVYVTTNSDWSGYTTTYIVIEYLKN